MRRTGTPTTVWKSATRGIRGGCALGVQPLTQLPCKHEPPAPPHATPSATSVYSQRLGCRPHDSAVQSLASLQSRGAPPKQAPLKQLSSRLHTLPSLQLSEL